MSMSRQIWMEKLGEFKKSTATSKELAKVCSEAALEHFITHGDTVYLTEFLDAMPKNYLRKAAFLGWARDHAPVIMKDGKLVKDTGKNAVKPNLAAACKDPFWNYLPDREVAFFEETDVVKSLMGVLKRLEAKKAKTESAAIQLDKAKKLVASLAPVKAISEPVAPVAPVPATDQPDNTETAEQAAKVFENTLAEAAA